MGPMVGVTILRSVPAAQLLRLRVAIDIQRCVGRAGGHGWGVAVWTRFGTAGRLWSLPQAKAAIVVRGAIVQAARSVA